MSAAGTNCQPVDQNAPTSRQSIFDMRTFVAATKASASAISLP
jgi:hypothetical protein